MPLEFPTVPLLFFPHWRHCHSSLGNSWLWEVADFPCLRSLSGAQEDCLGSSDCSSATASLMLGVGSRSLWRRLQRKSFLIPWAYTVGSASQARPGPAGFYTILFPFLPHSTLKSIEGSCHGVCKREHRRGQRTKRWFKILHETSSLISHLLTLPNLLCILLIWTLGYLLHPSDFPDPASASSVWSCCRLWCLESLMILPFGRDTALAVWHWLHIVGTKELWVTQYMSPSASCFSGFSFGSSGIKPRGWPAFLLEVQTHVSKGDYLLTSQPPAMLQCAPLSLQREIQEGHRQLRFSRRLINPRVYNIIILKFVF